MAATTSTTLGPESPDSHLFDIICDRAGISSSDLSDETKRALLRGEQTQELWEQLRARIHGHSNRPSTAANSTSRKQLAEFERVAAVQGLHDQASLTPDRIAQTEAELENLNRKTQSLVDTLRSHNTRLNAIADAGGAAGGSASSNGAKSAVNSKAAELRARKQALDEECEQMAAHADQRLDRYLDISHREKHRPNGVEAAGGRSPPGASDVLKETFDGLLGPHDRILEKLDALCTELQFDDSGQKAMLQDARRLSNETIFAIVAHQHMVLDIVFIQACESYQDDPRGSAAQAAEDDRETIVADLRSLWDEVVPVAHMAVEKQLVGPIMKSRGRESDMRDERYALIASYTSAMLRYMNERLEAFAIRIRTLIAHHRALVKTFQAFKNQTSGTSNTDSSAAVDTTVAQTLANQERARTVEKRKPGSRAAAARGIAAPSTPLDDLLLAIESLGVSLPPPPPPPALRQLQGGGAIAGVGDADQRHQASDLAQHLDRHIQRRTAKSHVLATDMQALFEATAKAHITDSLEAARVLADSLVAECSDGLLAPPDSTDDISSAAGQQDGVNGGNGGGGGDLFFADAELEKIIGDEARSVARIADEFRRLLRDANPGDGGGDGLEPHIFVADAYRRATTAGTGAAAAAEQGGGPGGMASRGKQRSQQQMLRDPKIHEMVERWGGRGGDIGVGG